MDTLSDDFFSEAKKILIQYFPIINYSEKYFLVNINLDARSKLYLYKFSAVNIYETFFYDVCVAKTTCY